MTETRRPFDGSVERSHTYLYPSEVLAFVGCPAVPLKWRRAVALAVYTFARASELRVLTLCDFDMEHGTIHVHRARDRITGNTKSTKTKHARRFALEPTIVPLIRTMHAEAEEGGKSDADPFVEMTSDRDLSRGLKRWLRKAGIAREELSTTDATRQALRFHDLRATGITWMAVRGDAPQLIQTRAGTATTRQRCATSARPRLYATASARSSPLCRTSPRTASCPSSKIWYQLHDFSAGWTGLENACGKYRIAYLRSE